MKISLVNLNLNCSCYAATVTFHRSSTLRLRSTSSLACSRTTIPRTKAAAAAAARDMTIDFGRYKGKMLGSLPSAYLKWVSSNLRARDFEHWANLADQVLADPVYRDRIEWESAQNLLDGNTLAPSSSDGGRTSELLAEISESFGWDNDDRLGWSRIDFALLGTSKGGRIPRRATRSKAEGVSAIKKETAAGISNKDAGSNGVDDNRRSSNRRSDRRERLRMKRSSGEKDKTGTGLGVGLECEGVAEEHGSGDDHVMDVRPFPGRESLLLFSRRRSSTTATGRKKGRSPPPEMN